jgi:hypothetical protein
MKKVQQEKKKWILQEQDVSWIQTPQNRLQSCACLNMIMNLRFPSNTGNCSTRWWHNLQGSPCTWGRQLSSRTAKLQHPVCKTHPGSNPKSRSAFRAPPPPETLSNFSDDCHFTTGTITFYTHHFMSVCLNTASVKTSMCSSTITWSHMGECRYSRAHS